MRLLHYIMLFFIIGRDVLRHDESNGATSVTCTSLNRGMHMSVNNKCTVP